MSERLKPPVLPRQPDLSAGVLPPLLPSFCKSFTNNKQEKIAAEMAEEALTGDGMTAFTALDYSLFVLLLLMSSAIGVYSAIRYRHKSNLEEYLLGGRTMSPVLLSFSLIAGVVSAGAILGLSAEVYFYGTQISASIVGLLVGCLLSSHVILPVFFNLNIISVNQYVELRFNSPSLRKMATILQLISLVLSISICMYATSMTLAAVTRLTTRASVIIMGTVLTFYVTLGGVRAVVYTHVLQILTVLTGVVMLVIICSNNLGGIANVWHMAQQGSRLEFFNMDTNPFVRHTFWSTTALGFFLAVAFFSMNQASYQRFASVTTLRTVKRLFPGIGTGVAVLWILFYLSGLVAYATYKDCDPLTSGLIEKPDQLLPYMVMDRLGHLSGFPGIFVAAAYGASLSSMSSCCNAIVCLIWEDLLKHNTFFKNLSDVQKTSLAKIISVVTGVVTTCLALFIGGLGNVFFLSYITLALVGGPITGVFLTGMCAPWVNTKSVVMGYLVSTVVNIWLLVGKYLYSIQLVPILSLSTERCLDNMVNSSLALDDMVNSSLASVAQDLSTSEVMFSAVKSLVNVTSHTLPNITLSDGMVANTLGSNNEINNMAARGRQLAVTIIDNILPNLTLTRCHLSNKTVIEVLTNITSSDSQADVSLYDISYCYTGVLGISLTMVFSTIFSCCTGPLAPGDTHSRLLEPHCHGFHKWLWRISGVCNARTTEVNPGEELEMLPQDAPARSHHTC